MVSVNKYLTITNLFALTTICMIAGHVAEFFIPDNLWLRIPDRALVLTYLLSIGYNAGHKFGALVYGGAVLIAIGNQFVPYGAPINILGTFIIIKIILDPLMDFLVKSKWLLWVVSALFAFFSPFTNVYVEYGSIALLMAMAGWINRNRDEVAQIVTPKIFYIFSYFSYLWFTQITFMFSEMQFLCIAISSGLMMLIFYDYRMLILNSLRRRPKDIIEKTCAFMAHKSLEVYIFHVLLFMLIVYIATH